MSTLSSFSQRTAGIVERFASCEKTAGSGTVDRLNKVGVVPPTARENTCTYPAISPNPTAASCIA